MHSHRHRAGISLGLVIILLGSGTLGYLIGANEPTVVFNLQHPLSEIVGAVVMALFAGVIWLIGEGITGLTQRVGREATTVRLAISLIGSFVSVVTTALDLAGVHLIGPPDPHSIFAYGPIASGLGSVALGAHALLHQFRLDRDASGNFG